MIKPIPAKPAADCLPGHCNKCQKPSLYYSTCIFIVKRTSCLTGSTAKTVFGLPTRRDENFLDFRREIIRYFRPTICFTENKQTNTYTPAVPKHVVKCCRRRFDEILTIYFSARLPQTNVLH